MAMHNPASPTPVSVPALSHHNRPSADRAMMMALYVPDSVTGPVCASLVSSCPCLGLCLVIALVMGLGVLACPVLVLVLGMKRSGVVVRVWGILGLGSHSVAMGILLWGFVVLSLVLAPVPSFAFILSLNLMISLIFSSPHPIRLTLVHVCLCGFSFQSGNSISAISSSPPTSITGSGFHTVGFVLMLIRTLCRLQLCLRS